MNLRNGMQRRRLTTPGRLSVEMLSPPTHRPELAAPSLEEVLLSLDRMPDVADWSAVARMVMPVFPRARPNPELPDVGERVSVQLPPGITVNFALDLGAGFVGVTKRMLERWDRHQGAVVSQAIENLRRRAAMVTTDYVIEEPSSDGYSMKALQPPGAWASTLLLLPDELERIFGSAPCTFVAPMRSLLMAFPADVDLDTVTFFAEEIESLDPNSLRLEAFLLREGRLSVLPLPRSDAGLPRPQTV